MGDLLYLRKLECPICGTSFKSTKIMGSKLKYIKSDTDLCRYYEGGNPYLYEMNVCPKCGFSFSDHFNEPLSSVQIVRFLKNVSKHWKEKDYCGERDMNSAIEVYKLGLLSAQVLGLKTKTIAGICLRICWLYRMLGDSVQERRFLQEAAELFEKSYDTEDYGSAGMGPEIVAYLLGELNYRLGKRDKVLMWFNVAITKYGRDSSIKKQTSDMIKDRWMDIKDEYKKKGQQI